MGRFALPLLACIACGRINFDLTARDDGGAVLPDIVYRHNVVFTTPPEVVVGSLGTLAAADARCQEYASQSGLPGRYVAWLSTTTTNAIDRLAGYRGWVRPDGMPVVDLPSDLVNGRMLMPPLLDHFARGATPNVVTGTTGAGTLHAGGACADLTSLTAQINSGTNYVTHTTFTDNGSVFFNCFDTVALYCFGVDQTTPIELPPVVGLRAFVSAPWIPTGIVAADMRCQADAALAGLTGTFLALLSTATSDGRMRFATGSHWVRLDGIALQKPGIDPLAGLLVAPLNLAFDGNYVGDADSVWRGGGLLNTDCADWLNSSPGMEGDVAWPNSPSLDAIFRLPCDSTQARLFCLEQ